MLVAIHLTSQCWFADDPSAMIPSRTPTYLTRKYLVDDCGLSPAIDQTPVCIQPSNDWQPMGHSNQRSAR